MSVESLRSCGCSQVVGNSVRSMGVVVFGDIKISVNFEKIPRFIRGIMADV